MPTRTNERSLYGDIYSLLLRQQVKGIMLPQVVCPRETMANCSPRLLLAKLHDEFAMGRVRFVTSRSSGRRRQALHGLYRKYPVEQMGVYLHRKKGAQILFQTSFL